MRIADRTLCRENCTFSFKEKMEIVRQLDRLQVDVIELPAVDSPKTDILLVRTVSSFVGNAVLSVAAGLTAESIDLSNVFLRNGGSTVENDREAGESHADFFEDVEAKRRRNEDTLFVSCALCGSELVCAVAGADSDSK